MVMHLRNIYDPNFWRRTRPDLNSLLVKCPIDNPSPGAVTGGNLSAIVRVFSDVSVAFLYFDICHQRQSNLAIENPEFSQPVVAGHFQ